MVRPLQSPVVWLEMTTPCHPTIARRLRLPPQIQAVIASLSANAPLMAEHLTLEERDRDPGTIEHSKGLRGPGAAGMDQPRHEFLPRPSLTGEQYWLIDAGHQFDEASQLEHLWVRTDEHRQVQRQLLRGG